MWLHFICNHVTGLPMPKIVFLCLPMIDFLCLPIPYVLITLVFLCLPMPKMICPQGYFTSQILFSNEVFFFFLHDIILYFAKLRLKTLHHNK